MLTRELAIAEYDSGRIVPDRLTQNHHAHYLGLVEQILNIYRNGTGRTRRDLHQSVHHVFAKELDCPVRRIDAFCKLLDEKSSYDRDRRGNASMLRQQVFRIASAHHPLVQRADRLFETCEAEVKRDIARQLGKSWFEIERELFADIMQFHRLKEFPGYASAVELLSRYNVAQCQAVLYDAISMTVWAGNDFKTILRYAKLARLMHTIERLPDGSYVFRFDGAASVVRRSRRYGVAMARFLPALLACSEWKMQARIQHRRSKWENIFRLSPADGLTTNHADPDLFDSALEESFAKRWGDKPRAGWTMIREGEVLSVGQKVFVPDFVFRHASGERVLMEIVGFWTPEYLTAKLETLNRFRDHQIMLAIADDIDWPDHLTTEMTSKLIRYKSSIQVGEVLSRLQQRLNT
jgi:predicted nuclease of restriction endonuclease-like RecB superfamily